MSDLLISDGKIADISENIPADGAEVTDAGGRYVFAGGVDVHTHLNLSLGGGRQVSDGFYYGTKAALHGGVTTIVDHPEFGPAGCPLNHQVEYYKKMLRNEAVTDYSIHGVLQRADKDVLDDIPKLVKEGIYSMKAYLTYDGMLDREGVKRVLTAMKACGGLTAFHAEDNQIISSLRQKFAAEGRLDAVYHAKSRPDVSEAVAISEILETADKCGNASVYIVHLSTAKGLEVIRRAKAKGHSVYAETCPQYLLLDESMYKNPDGIKYIMSPPLRTRENCDALWEGLADKTIDTVATDHCSFSHADKVKFHKGDFRNVPGGCPGVETRLPLLYSYGVAEKRISINRFTELVSEAPAKIMGLAPKKGTLAVGSDADIVIWQKTDELITYPKLHQKCDYTPFEGLRITGRPLTVFLRGEKLLDNGETHVRQGFGQFIKRGII